jgi:AAA15 family ATPase/GTPase
VVIIYINRENFSLRGETMLVRFSVENFMSYDKKQTFSMIAGRTRNHSDHLYSVENVELLKVSAIYGANASGKSKLVEAMRFACHVINNEIPVSASNQFCKLTAENKHKPSTFDFEFCVNGMFYAYGFSAILSQRTVVAEWLYRLYPDKDKQDCIYEREKDESGSYSLYLNNTYLNLSDEEANSLQVINEFMDMDRVLFLKTINESKKYTEKKNYRCLVVVYNFFSEDIEFIMPDSTDEPTRPYIVKNYQHIFIYNNSAEDI